MHFFTRPLIFKEKKRKQEKKEDLLTCAITILLLLQLEMDKKDPSAHTKNEENRFVLTGYCTTKIFLNANCIKVQSQKTQTQYTIFTNVIGKYGEVNVKDSFWVLLNRQVAGQPNNLLLKDFS